MALHNVKMRSAERAVSRRELHQFSPNDSLQEAQTLGYKIPHEIGVIHSFQCEYIDLYIEITRSPTNSHHSNILSFLSRMLCVIFNFTLSH